ncbi:unnamed protein product [Polarella glacialis]|uniref:HIT domain-containing protein n=1 Tax=Polarella glacialis TaxID=89957 RepID=A0A813HDL3_POLGL|nr:unnamed protein product [Polarella glacialis]CAE8635717.1 unnamed protein product [Polarella glacialis]
MGGQIASGTASEALVHPAASDGLVFRKGVWVHQSSQAVFRSVYDDVREGKDPLRPLEARTSLQDAMRDGQRGKTGFYEDDLVTCFVPRDPSASLHLLMVPREYVRNADDLQGTRHAALLEHMYAVGRQQLELCARELGLARSSGDSSYLFHVAPFNSIDHLHLHCLLRPFDSCVAWLKYWALAPWCRSIESIQQSVASRLCLPV